MSGDIEIPAYVLDDGTRVLSQRGLQTGIGMSTGGGSKAGEQRIAVFMDGLAQKGVVIKDLAARLRDPIRFATPGGGGSLNGERAGCAQMEIFGHRWIEDQHAFVAAIVFGFLNIRVGPIHDAVEFVSDLS